MSLVRFVGRARRPGGHVSALILGIVLGCSAAAHAGSIVHVADAAHSSLHGLGAFAGTISYSTASPLSTTGTLVIALTNTSSSTNGGYITGMLFNLGGGDSGASAALREQSRPFIDCTGGGLQGDPYGAFEAGGAIDGSFLGSGDAHDGIGVGRTGVFTFDISAADAGALTATDFLAGGAFDFNFLVRFRGFEDGGSDRIGATVVDLPSALGLGLVGLFGATLFSRLARRRRVERKNKS